MIMKEDGARARQARRRKGSRAACGWSSTRSTPPVSQSDTLPTSSSWVRHLRFVLAPAPDAGDSG
jgi:hypothetical protein